VAVQEPEVERPVENVERETDVDICFDDFEAELTGQRRPCKSCGRPVPHGKRAYCDDCLPHVGRSTQDNAGELNNSGSTSR
jgi:hypothetical protein